MGVISRHLAAGTHVVLLGLVCAGCGRQHLNFLPSRPPVLVDRNRGFGTEIPLSRRSALRRRGRVLIFSKGAEQVRGASGARVTMVHVHVLAMNESSLPLTFRPADVRLHLAPDQTFAPVRQTRVKQPALWPQGSPGQTEAPAADAVPPRGTVGYDLFFAIGPAEAIFDLRGYAVSCKVLHGEKGQQEETEVKAAFIAYDRSGSQIAHAYSSRYGFGPGGYGYGRHGWVGGSGWGLGYSSSGYSRSGFGWGGGASFSGGSGGTSFRGTFGTVYP